MLPGELHQAAGLLGIGRTSREKKDVHTAGMRRMSHRAHGDGYARTAVHPVETVVEPLRSDERAGVAQIAIQPAGVTGLGKEAAAAPTLRLDPFSGKHARLSITQSG